MHWNRELPCQEEKNDGKENTLEGTRNFLRGHGAVHAAVPGGLSAGHGGCADGFPDGRHHKSYGTLAGENDPEAGACGDHAAGASYWGGFGIGRGAGQGGGCAVFPGYGLPGGKDHAAKPGGAKAAAFGAGCLEPKQCPGPAAGQCKKSGGGELQCRRFQRRTEAQSGKNCP